MAKRNTTTNTTTNTAAPVAIAATTPVAVVGNTTGIGRGGVYGCTPGSQSNTISLLFYSNPANAYTAGQVYKHLAANLPAGTLPIAQSRIGSHLQYLTQRGYLVKLPAGQGWQHNANPASGTVAAARPMPAPQPVAAAPAKGKGKK